MNDAAQEINVWILSDGRPGHYNQSRGIIEALKLLHPVKIEWLDIYMKTGFCRELLKTFLHHGDRPLPWFILRACYKLPNLPNHRPDLIVSAGGKTSFLNVAMARRFRCKNIFIGSLRGLWDGHFSAVLTIEPIIGAKRNIVLDIAPTTIRPDEVTAAGLGFRQQKGLEGASLWAMIIGGEGAGYTYEEEDWSQLAAAMVDLADKNHIRWLLTTSRRTGADVEAQLQKILPAKILADSVWYATEPKKVMFDYLGASELVFCTEDSMSMIAESIASGSAVITLSPRNKNPEKRYSEALQRYADKFLISRLNIESVESSLLKKNIRDLKPLTVATDKLLAEKLKPLFESQGGKQ